MTRTVFKSILLGCISFFCLLTTFAQNTTVRFDELDGSSTTGSIEVGAKAYTSGGLVFEIIPGTNSGVEVSASDNGPSTGSGGNTYGIDDTNTVAGGVVGWKITKEGGGAFQFVSAFLLNGDTFSSQTGDITAYSGGSPVGGTYDANFNGLINFGGLNQFWNVDEVRIEASDIFLIIDDVTYGPAINPVDADPPLVTNIALVGTPLSTVTSVNYLVTFSKEAKNVSSDDFQLTTAGTTGAVGAVSGSGSSYTVAVNGIDGEGTIRLDLKGGTNIANVDDTQGTPAFTSGQLHLVGACFVEMFETETDASTSFSGNGVNFSLGTGLEIEKRTGFGAGNSNGYIKNNNTAGSFSLSSATEFTMKTVDLFLSDLSIADLPSATGSLTITGKKGGVDQYSITKSSGFPTNTTFNGGFFTIDFSTDGAGNYRNTNVDELVFTISGGFIELAIDNMNFCEAAPDVDNQAPVVQSISKIGFPLSTAGTVDFQVTFDEAASNVSLDDFTLLKTGTATGALTGISGSGSIYTLSITGIAGKGSIQIKLNSGTNIQDALGNTPPFEFLNGEFHLVGACYIETFEIGDGAFSWISNGKMITLGENWIVRDRIGFGINSSDGFVENRLEGPYILSVDIPVKFSKLALFLSSNTLENAPPTNDGSVTIRGKNGTTTEYTITKNTGFPTDFSSNNGYFYIDFATEGGVDNSTTYVDGLEIEIGGSFIYLAMDNLEFCSDFDAPAGYSATIDQDPIREKISTAASFTFADAEIGTTYNYTLSSAGGGTDVTGSGTIATANDQITGIDLSGLGVGTVTLSVTLTDPSGNIGDPANDTKQKIANNVPVATAPTVPVVIEDETDIPLADDIQVADGDGDDQTLTFTITGGTVTLEATDITFGGSGNGSASFTAAGTLAALNTALDAATFTPTTGLFGTDAGTIAFVANDGLMDSNSASVTFDIGQKGPTESSLITVSRISGDYDGNPFEATGGATGLGGIILSPSVTFEYEQYDGSTWSGIAGAPIDAGDYRVRSNFAGNTEYIAGSSDWTAFTINKIAAGITVSRSNGDYDGNPLEATGGVTGLGGVGLSPSVTLEYESYDGSNWSGIAGAPTDAGAYRVRSNFAGNTNYTSGSSDWTAFAINQIAATITVTRTSSDYDGNPFEATGSATGLEGALSPVVTLEYQQYDGNNWSGITGAPTDAGAYRVRSNFAGNTNYTSGSSDWQPFAINQIAATITVSRASGDYNGSPFEATGDVTGLGGVALSPVVTLEYQQYDGNNWSGIAGAPTDAGAYRVRSNFAGNLNYTSGSSGWTAFAINQIAANITVSRTSGDYNGSPFEATGEATGLGETSLSPAVTLEYQQYDGNNWSGIAGAPTDAGAYRVRSNFAGNLNYTSGSSDWTAFAINQIAATITVDRASGDYNGSPFEATGDVTGLGGAALSPAVTFEYQQFDSNNWSGIAGAPTDAGAYRVRSNFAGNLNYTSGSSDWTAFAIDKVNASVTPNSSSKYCGQEDPDNLSGTLAGFISGDNVTATYSINGDVISATLSPVGVLGNYNITYNTAVFSVLDVVIDVSESGTPVPIGSTATLTARIAPAVNGVSVQFLLDNVPYSTVLSNNGIATIDVQGLELGVYKITAIVGNDCGESIAYLPIFDPDGNFVTGAGWIDSPAGAYKADESLTGKANFGFLSKYKKGSNRVEGKTDFQFKAGDLKFKSTLHESGSLVISGKKATYRGEGTINDIPGFRFTLVALDGDWNGETEPDQFRIKIWGDSGIIYDNGNGTDDNSDVATVLGGGSIAIHKAKNEAKNNDNNERRMVKNSSEEGNLESILNNGFTHEPKFGEFRMFPNPAHAEVNLEVEVDQSTNVWIRIFDGVGRLVYQQEGLQSRSLTYRINIDDLSAGYYVVQVVTDQLVMDKILIKK